MPAKAELDRWYNGLSPQQKSEARKAGETGQLTDALADSLQEAGLLKGGKADRSGSRDVTTYLKTRH
jgi:hypothetical protein